MNTKPQHSKLIRELGIFGATMMGLGSIVGTGIFVSIGVAAGSAGPSVIVAIAVAALIATCNALSSAQLAASLWFRINFVMMILPRNSKKLLVKKVEI